MADANISFGPVPLSIRPAMGDRVRHPLEHGRRDRRTIKMNETSYPAHVSYPGSLSVSPPNDRRVVMT
jgi:hypothetical protein